MLPANHKHEVIYFLPGQLVFHLSEVVSQKAIQDIIDWANTIAKKEERFATVSISKRGDSVAFEPPSHQYTHSKAAKTPSETRRVNNPMSSTEISGLNLEKFRPTLPPQKALTLIFADVNNIKIQSDLLDLILLLDKRRRKAPGKVLEVVSPNWLTSSSSEPGTVGGPGGRPVPYAGKAATKEYMFHSPAFPANGEGQGVTVAILDTAPRPEVLDGIYTQWVERPSDEDAKHSLLQSLLDPRNRRLTVHPDANVDTAPLKDMQADGHEYDMTDHGLFVSGIIHSLAPEADIHLFQVLNRYGVGDFESIARTLKQVYDQFRTQPLVINLSLTFNLPLELGHLPSNLGWQILFRWEFECESSICRKIRNWLCRIFWGAPWLERQALPMETICRHLYDFRSRVIAAAGNNYDETTQASRPQACYPAALDSVVGVGALPKSKTPLLSSDNPKLASYSNLADRPPRVGITTFGGEEGAGEGVLGIYLGEFPPSRSNPTPTANANGWGWWAGTSFATPIISGATAKVLSANPGFSTQEAIEVLYVAQATVAGEGEDVLDVTQGPPPPP